MLSYFRLGDGSWKIALWFDRFLWGSQGRQPWIFVWGKNFLERYANSKPTQCFAWENHPKPPANWRNTSFLSLPGQAGKIQDCSRIHPFPTRNLPICFFPLLHCIYIYIVDIYVKVTMKKKQFHVHLSSDTLKPQALRLMWDEIWSLRQMLSEFRGQLLAGTMKIRIRPAGPSL